MGATRNPAWTYSEIDLLKEKMELLSAGELCGLFPNRTKKAIMRKIEKLRAEGKVGYRTKMRKRRKLDGPTGSWEDKDWDDDWS